MIAVAELSQRIACAWVRLYVVCAVLLTQPWILRLWMRLCGLTPLVQWKPETGMQAVKEHEGGC